MALERIGEIGGSGNDPPAWQQFIKETTIAYLRCVCGPEPTRCELDVFDFDHELGSYPILCLEYPNGFALPEEYARKCEAALNRLEDYLPWSELEPSQLEEAFDECGPEFDDTMDMTYVSVFAQELIAGCLLRTDTIEEVRTAVEPLRAAVERLPRITKDFDGGVVIHSAEADHNLIWCISLSDSCFSVTLEEEKQVDGVVGRSDLRSYSIELDGDEGTEQDDDDEHDFFFDPEMVAGARRIIFTDYKTKATVSQEFKCAACLIENDGQTAFAL
jgi:hypothetical protein